MRVLKPELYRQLPVIPTGTSLASGCLPMLQLTIADLIDLVWSGSVLMSRAHPGTGTNSVITAKTLTQVEISDL